MQHVSGYYGVLNVFEEAFAKETDAIEQEEQHEALSLWRQFQEAFAALILFVVSKGETGENVSLSPAELANIKQFLRWAQYSILSGFNVPSKKISDFIPNLPSFIGNATLEVFYVGIEPNDKICIIITAPVKFYKFRQEFLLPIDRHDFENRHKQLYDDISESKWQVNSCIEGINYKNTHSLADIIKCGTFDAFMVQFINSSEVVKQLFMKYYKELNLRGINQKLEDLEHAMRDKRDLLSGTVPISMQEEHKQLKALKLQFQQADKYVPMPVEYNTDLYKYSLLFGILFSEETQEFYISKKYDMNASSATFLMEFYNRDCLNYNMEHNILVAIMNVSLVEDFREGINFFKARFHALDFNFKEQLLSEKAIKHIEDVIYIRREYEQYLQKIESIEYDSERNQIIISGSLTEKDYLVLTKHIEHGIVKVIYEEGHVVLQFFSNLSSMLATSKIFSEIQDKQSAKYSELEEYLSLSVYKQPGNKETLRQQERVYNKIMLLKQDLNQLRTKEPIHFEEARKKAINKLFEDILNKVQAALFGAIANILDSEG
jgi:hypothetical protein